MSNCENFGFLKYAYENIMLKIKQLCLIEQFANSDFNCYTTTALYACLVLLSADYCAKNYLVQMAYTSCKGKPCQ